MHPRKKHRDEYWSKVDRETYECPDCGRGFEEVSEFQVHHIDGDCTNGDMENLVALCRDCHHDRHGEFTRRYTPEGIRIRERRYIQVMQ